MKSFKELFTSEEIEIIKKYEALADMNPQIECGEDSTIYVFIKIMFEHPLKDGNKRFAFRWLFYCFDGRTFDKILLKKIKNFLGKEVM